MLQAMQNNAASGFKRCDYQQPLDAGDYPNVVPHEIEIPRSFLQDERDASTVDGSTGEKGTELCVQSGCPGRQVIDRRLSSQTSGIPMAAR